MCRVTARELAILFKSPFANTLFVVGLLLIILEEDNQNMSYEFDSSSSESRSEQDGEGGTGGQEPGDEDDDPEPPPEAMTEPTTATPAQYICAKCGAEIDGATSYMQWTT